MLRSFLNLLKEETPEKYGAVFVIFIIISLLCEVFVFNYKWIDSAGSDEVRAENIQLTGIENDNGRLVFSNDSSTININDVDQKVKYLGFKLEESGKDTGILKITISAKDEGNSSRALTAPERVITTSEEDSWYIPLHFSGNIDSMQIKVEKESSGDVICDGITLNAKVPLIFSVPRFLALLFILMAVYIMRPKSAVYNIVTDLHNSKQITAVIIAAVVMILAFGGMIKWNTGTLDWYKTYDHHRMYYELVDAFENGHVYLEDEPSEELKEMENPYDYAARIDEGVDFKWDHAYFNGKYYVYFGAVPAVLMYLPYNLITGNDLPNYVAVYILGIFYIVGVLILLWEIIKKWFKKTPFALYILMSVVFAAAPALTYASYKPDFYLVPVFMALTFAVYGIALWLSAERIPPKGESVLINWRLCLGSLCIALTAGCRPQFLIAALFGVMLFWDKAFKTRELFSKKGIRQTVALCVPFVVIGIIIMAYNAARFGSPFDFGANYNLTTNDMTKRGFVWGRTGLGIFTYLLQPLHIDALFPFLHDFDKATSYQGLTLTEKLMGGALWLYPILFMGIVGLFRKDLFDDKKAYRMLCMGLVMTVIVVVADTQMAGLLTRYYMDFVWLMMIGSVITVFAIYAKTGGNMKARAQTLNITAVLAYVTIALAFLTIFAHTEDPIMGSNPGLYYKIQYMIAFWL